jgi:hypothetical protein
MKCLLARCCRHRDELEELQEHDAKLLQLRKLQHGDVLMNLQRQVRGRTGQPVQQRSSRPAAFLVGRITLPAPSVRVTAVLPAARIRQLLHSWRWGQAAARAVHSMCGAWVTHCQRASLPPPARLMCCVPHMLQVDAARDQNSKLAEELEDCMMELRAWQEENRRVRKMLSMAQGMKDAGGLKGEWEGELRRLLGGGAAHGLHSGGAAASLPCLPCLAQLGAWLAGAGGRRPLLRWRDVLSCQPHAADPPCQTHPSCRHAANAPFSPAAHAGGHGGCAGHAAGVPPRHAAAHGHAAR